jgi:hypothetical protein
VPARVVAQLAQRDREHAHDLARIGRERHVVQAADEAVHEDARGALARRQAAEHVHRGGRYTDLLLALAQGAGDRVLVAGAHAAREPDLPGVLAQIRGAHGEHERLVAGLTGDRAQHGREPQRRRLPRTDRFEAFAQQLVEGGHGGAGSRTRLPR